MNRFKDILVYVDTHSDVPPPALDRALELAKVNGAKVTVVDVLPDMPWHASGKSAMQERIRQTMEEQKRLRLADLVKPFEKAGVPVNVQVLGGKPFLALTQAVLRDGHDLVMKTAMGEKEYYERAFGETAMHLFRKCPCPVWIERPGKASARNHVAVCIDPTPMDEGRNALMRRLLQLGHALSEREGMRLSVLHAWSVYGQHLAHVHFGAQAAAAYEDEVRGRIEEYIVYFVKSELPAIRKNQIYLLETDPRNGISDYVESKKVDMLVLGTVARTGVQGLLIGNTAESLMNLVKCSVLVVKPEGFVSPVRYADGEGPVRAR